MRALQVLHLFGPSCRSASRLAPLRPSFLTSVTSVYLRPQTTSALESAPPPSNKHLSPDPDGNIQVDLSFVEEPLGISAEQGHGFAQLDFGERIGPDQRFQILRKLGFGMNSSIWLALDTKSKDYVAIKVLKGYSTGLAEKGAIWELQAFESLADPRRNVKDTHCLALRSHFTHPGKDNDGSHLCFVTDVMGGDVRSLISVYNGNPFPIALAKRILHHTLQGLAHIHARGVVHTDLKHDNIMFDAGVAGSSEALASLLARDPPGLNPPEESWEKVVRSAVSQPLPLPSAEEAIKRSYILGDFGSAQSSTEHRVDEITALTLRAPETILRAPWNEKVDIWAFGCLIFEMLIGQQLFKYEAYPQHGLDEAGGHLWQMQCFTGEKFRAHQLNMSVLAPNYFDEDCMLKSHPPNFSNPIEMSMRNYKRLDEPTIQAASALAKKCLRLDPINRASAKELLRDPWWGSTP